MYTTKKIENWGTIPDTENGGFWQILFLPHSAWTRRTAEACLIDLWGLNHGVFFPPVYAGFNEKTPWFPEKSLPFFGANLIGHQFTLNSIGNLLTLKPSRNHFTLNPIGHHFILYIYEQYLNVFKPPILLDNSDIFWPIPGYETWQTTPASQSVPARTALVEPEEHHRLESLSRGSFECSDPIVVTRFFGKLRDRFCRW